MEVVRIRLKVSNLDVSGRQLKSMNQPEQTQLVTTPPKRFMKRLMIVIIMTFCFIGGIIGAKFHPKEMWDQAVYRAANQMLHGIPFLLTLGQPGETNNYTIELIGNVIRIDNLTNTTGWYKASTNIWMRDSQ